MAEFELIENLPFTTESVVGHRARIGLVVLSSDYMIEHEFRTLLANPDVPQGVDLFVSRIDNAPNITPETLAAMGPAITETASRLLPGDALDVLAYGCTSASMVLGPDAVSAMLNAAKPEANTTNPASAAIAALHALNAKRIAVLTPYTSDVNRHVRTGLANGGFEIPVFGSFNEPMDPIVASIDTNSLKSAVQTLIKGRDVDAVFVSCTSIRLMHAVGELESEFDLPVISSNLAMAWHSLRLAGIDHRVGSMGRLLEI